MFALVYLPAYFRSNLLFFLFLVTGNLCAQSTIIVDDEGGGDYFFINAAIQNASPGDIILVTGGSDNIHREPDVRVTKNVTIKGEGKNTTIVQAAVNAGDVYRSVFTVLSDATIEDMTIRHGTFEVGSGIYIQEGTLALNNVCVRDNEGPGAFGGGIYVEQAAKLIADNCHIVNNGLGSFGTPSLGGGIGVAGVLELTNSVIENNRAEEGAGLAFVNTGTSSPPSMVAQSTIFDNVAGSRAGGVQVELDVQMQNVTVANNSSLGDGGGFMVLPGGSLNLLHATVAGNSAIGNGGGINTDLGTLQMVNSLVGDNSAGGTGQDLEIASFFTVNQNNLVEDCNGLNCGVFTSTSDPALLPLADNGGNTPTIALQGFSPAVNRGNAALGLGIDQRGLSRDNFPDIGAFEFGGGTAAPDIAVIGNGISIADGALTISKTNHTDFGKTEIGKYRLRRYTIVNAGNEDLVLSGMNNPDFSGDDAVYFSFRETIAGETLAPGESLIFWVEYRPTALGEHTVQVNIGSNDPDEGSFNFTVGGQGVLPDIQVLGNGIPIANNDDSPDLTDGTNLGSADFLFSQNEQEFTIGNSGEGTLTLNSFSIPVQSFPNTFSLELPSRLRIGPGRSRTFKVIFDPPTTGIFTATIRINSNDPDEGIYEFQVAGQGTSEPEISVLSNDENIFNGETLPKAEKNTDFGSVSSGMSKMFTYTIKNQGSQDLELTSMDPVVLISNIQEAFQITTQPGLTTIPPNGEQTFSIKFQPPGPGFYTSQVRIPNNDANESGFTFTIQGEAPCEVPLAPNTYLWTNASGDKQWSNPENWLQPSGEIGVPTENARVFFGCGANEDCILDVDPTVAEIRIDPTYLGTVSLNGKILTITKSLFNFRDIDDSQGTLRFAGNIVQCSSSQPITNLELNCTRFEPNLGLIVTGKLTITNLGALQADIDLRGDLELADPDGFGGSGHLKLSGNNNQSISGGGVLRTLEIQKPSGLVQLDDPLHLTNGSLMGSGQITGERVIASGNFTFDFSSPLSQLELINDRLVIQGELEVSNLLTITSLGTFRTGVLNVIGNLVNESAGFNGGGVLKLTGFNNQTISGSGSFQKLNIDKSFGRVILGDPLQIRNGTLEGNAEITGNAVRMLGDGTLKYTGPIEMLELIAGTLTLRSNAQVKGDLLITALFQLTGNYDLSVEGDLICDDNLFSGNTRIVLNGNNDSAIRTASGLINGAVIIIVRKSRTQASVTLEAATILSKLLVEAGQFDPNGFNLTAPVVVRNGGRLIGNGSFNQGVGLPESVVIKTGGQIAPGNAANSIGTLSFADLNMESSSSVNFDISDSSNDMIQVSGSINLRSPNLFLTVGEAPSGSILLIDLANPGIPFSGRFLNAKDDATVALAGQPFRYNYNLGGSKDLTLDPVQMTLLPKEQFQMNQSGLQIDWQVYPNPVKEVLNIQLPFSESKIYLQLFDANGNSVKEYHSTDRFFSFPVEELPGGTYYLWLRFADRMDYKKVLIVK